MRKQATNMDGLCVPLLSPPLLSVKREARAGRSFLFPIYRAVAVSRHCRFPCRFPCRVSHLPIAPLPVLSVGASGGKHRWSFRLAHSSCPCYRRRFALLAAISVPFCQSAPRLACRMAGREGGIAMRRGISFRLPSARLASRLDGTYSGKHGIAYHDFGCHHRVRPGRRFSLYRPACRIASGG